LLVLLPHHFLHVSRIRVKKEENGIGLDTHYVKKQEQQRKPHEIGILSGTEEEVGRRECGKGQQKMK
jgi:hypothetical protein